MKATQQALSTCVDYKEMQHPNCKPSNGKMQWKLPDEGWWKLNVDGVMFPDLCGARVGCALCDDHNQVAMATTLPEVHYEDPIEIELLAMFKSLQLYVKMDIWKLMVETNCLVAVQAMEEGSKAHVSYNHLIQEILTLANSFELYKFNYVS